MRELETALGQYLIYRAFLKRTLPGVSIYLAVPEDIHKIFFCRPEIGVILSDYAVNLLVFAQEK